MKYILLYLCITIVILAVALKRSMKESVYSYRNIGLTGGILFQAVFLAFSIRYVVNLDINQSLSFAYESVIAFPRTFSYYAVFVMTVICVLLGISNISLMRHEGACLQHALSLLVSVMYIGGTAIAYIVSEKLMEYVFVPLGLSENRVFIVLNTIIPLFMLMGLCYFECIFAGSIIMGWIAARSVPVYDKDYIIILGCSLDKRGGLLPLLRGRVNRAVTYAHDQENRTGKLPKYIPSGGQGPNEVISEGAAMEQYLRTHGTKDDEIIPEKESRNTFENFLFSKRIIDRLTPEARVAFATTNYHILRSGILARKVGLDAEGVAAGTKWYFWPNGFIREFFGILVLEKKAHIISFVIMVIVCAAVGFMQYNMMM